MTSEALKTCEVLIVQYSNIKVKKSVFMKQSSAVLYSIQLFLVILCIASINGCIAKPTFTQITAYPTAISCFPDSVFTAEDMQARVNCHPDNYKIEISKDTVVLFAFHHPVIDWVAPIFIIHIPSLSDVTLNVDGSIRGEIYNSVEGQNAIEEVLNNTELMDEILQRAKKIGLFN